MSVFKEVVDQMLTRAERKGAITEGDYIGEDGLYHCGKCHTRKQTVVDFLGTKRTVFCICKCRADEIAAEEEAIKQREFFNKVMRMRSVGFPEKAMAEWTFENDDGGNPKLINAMKNYVEHFREFKEEGKGLLLFGPVGTGKTYLAACVANALINKGIPCLATDFFRISNEVQGTFEKQEYYDSLNEFPLLVIDDLKAESDTARMKDTVLGVINSRYRANLPLIVTTNLTREELLKPADLNYQRIFSRLFEMCTPIEVTGKDRRQQALRDDIGKMKDLLGL